MKSKWFVLFMVALIAASSLVGCGTGNAVVPPEPTTAGETAPQDLLGSQPVDIVLWHSMSDNAGVLMDQFVKEFNEGIGAEKKITIEAVFQGTYMDSVTKMNSILQAETYNDLPDVMQVDATGKIAYASSGKAYTVDQALKDDPDYDISKILGAALTNWQYAGVQLGMPFATSTTVMYYNKDLLDQAGVTSVPTTFAEIAAAAANMPKKTADGADIWTYMGVPNTPTLANWIGQLGGYVVDNKNGTDGSATKLVCDTEGTLETFLTEWKAMYDAGALYNSAGSTTDPFVAGQIAMMTGSSSNIRSLLDKINGSFEMGVAFYPKVNAQASFGATPSGSGLFVFDKGDALKKAAAWELVKYFTSPEIQARFAAGTGYIPANSDAVESDAYKNLIAELPQFSVGIEQLSVTPAEMRSVTIGPSEAFYYAIMDSTSGMLDNGLTVQDTVAEMSTTLNGLLTEYIKANP